jgi:hypothetical protein
MQTRGKRIDYKDLIRTNLINLKLVDTATFKLDRKFDRVDNKIEFENFGQYTQDLFASKVAISYKEASDDPQWKQAIDKEIDAWKRLNVFTLKPKTSKTKAIPVKWLFGFKENGERKARLVATGCRDPEKYTKDEKRSPTPCQLVFKWFLAILIRFGWSIQQIDIDHAFLNSEIDCIKYISIPFGFEGDKATQVGLLNKSLYGLQTASTCWNRTLNDFLTKNGFKRSPREECVYVKVISKTITILLLTYVDDILISSSSEKAICETITMFKNRFKIKELGFPKTFIGVNIEKVTESSILIHQKDRIASLLNEFPFDKNVKPTTPMLNLETWSLSDGEIVQNYPYRTVIGKLLYLANTTRLDISHSVGLLARAQCNPQPIHFKAISYLLSYLYHNSDDGLLYCKCVPRDSVLKLYADADYAGEKG